MISSPTLPLLLEISEHCDCLPVLADHGPLTLRKLMEVESGAWEEQLLEALEGRLATVATEADNKPRLVPNCGFLTFRSCDLEYDFTASYLFFRLLPHILDLGTVHLCLSVEEESLRNQQYDILPAGLIQQLTDDRYASVTIHEVAYALAELKAVRSPLRVFFADDCSKEGDRHWPCHTREQRLAELGPYMRMRSSDSSDWERIEFIGAGAVCEYEPCFDEDNPDFDWNKAPYLRVPEEDAQEEIAAGLRSAFLKTRDEKSYPVSYTLRSESEACLCCGGR